MPGRGLCFVLELTNTSEKSEFQIKNLFSKSAIKRFFATTHHAY